jgi:hypothetical protein
MSGEGLKHEEMRDDLAAFAIGALDDAESDAIRRHVSGCESCEEYLRWLQPAVDLLPASVEQLEPPRSLREGLMATVRAEAAPASAEEASGRSAARAQRRWSFPGLTLRPAAVLAAAVLVAGGVTGYVVSDSGEPQRELVRAQAIGSVPAGTLAAQLEYGAGGDAILHVERAPALDRGHVYQAWIQRDGVMEPSASFRPHDDGTAEAALGDSLEGATAVFVTEEPGPGKKKPTSPPILEASLGSS